MNHQQITRRGPRFVKISREHWDIFAAETYAAIGYAPKLPAGAEGKKNIKIQLEAWTFILCVIKLALVHAKYEGAENCCDDVCVGHGGCNFSYGRIAVCDDDDVFICGV